MPEKTGTKIGLLLDFSTNNNKFQGKMGKNMPHPVFMLSHILQIF